MHDTVALVIFVTLFLALPIYSESATKCLDLQHHGQCVNIKRFGPWPFFSGQGTPPAIGSSSSADTSGSSSATTAAITPFSAPSTQASDTTSPQSLTTTISSTRQLSVPSDPWNTASTSSISAPATTQTHGNPTSSSTSSSTANTSSISTPAATQTHGNPTSSSTSSSTPLPKSGVSKRGPMVTVGIVIGSCVAGIAIFWTVFRRWKFRRQSDRHLRVHPMDLPPTNAEGTGQHRGSVHPSNVVASPRSFKLGASSGQSGSGADHNRESTGGSSMSDHSWHSYRLSDHGLGFAASPTTLEPASSVQMPLMHQIDIMRDPSMTSLPPSYDVAVLLHNY
jgi:hypothetical protein